jgi:hypothetical protein
MIRLIKLEEIKDISRFDVDRGSHDDVISEW